MDSVQFLDAVRARHSIASDRKLAAFLGIEQPRVVSYRKRRRTLDPDACIAVAKALDLPPEHVLASVQAERAKRTEHRKLWERLARHAKTINVLCALGLVSAATLHSAPTRADETRVISIFCQNARRRRFWALWRDFFGGRPIGAVV